MIHRRCLTNDNRGLRSTLDETELSGNFRHTPISLKMKHFVIFSKTKSNSYSQKFHERVLNEKPLYFYSIQSAQTE